MYPCINIKWLSLIIKVVVLINVRIERKYLLFVIIACIYVRFTNNLIIKKAVKQQYFYCRNIYYLI